MNKVPPLVKFYQIGNHDYDTYFYEKLHHYTKNDVLPRIKESSTLKATSIVKYKTDYKEVIQYEQDQEYLVFNISFSHKKYSLKEVKKFKNSDALVTVKFINDMTELFDFTKPIITNNGDKLMWCNKEYSNYFLDENLQKNISVDVKCIDPKYCTDEELSNSKGEKKHIINYRPKLRKKEEWQAETRYEFIIRTTSTNNISKYEYLLIPIKISKLIFSEI